MLGGRKLKYKGIVIKLTKNKAIVTTEDFQCYYIKRSPTICVGKEVEFTGKEIIKKKHALSKTGFKCRMYNTCDNRFNELYRNNRYK